ncbi:hypothetical protein F5883DRAFT_204236 [Diaporthe sp. PMI_573]|nr:hypothetical protein F5883DRAFT_204236 [Diaporthaceae sp. PMI_573]
MERDDINVAYNTTPDQLFGAELNARHLMDVIYPAADSASLNAPQAWSNSPRDLIPTGFGVVSDAVTTTSTENAFGTSISQVGRVLPVNNTPLISPSLTWPTIQAHDGLISPESLASPASFVSCTIQTPITKSWDPGEYAPHGAQSASSLRDRLEQQDSEERYKRDSHDISTKKPRSSRKFPSTAGAKKKGKGSHKESNAVSLSTLTPPPSQDSRELGRKKMTSKVDNIKSTEHAAKGSIANKVYPDTNNNDCKEGRGEPALKYHVGSKRDLPSPRQTCSLSI